MLLTLKPSVVVAVILLSALPEMTSGHEIGPFAATLLAWQNEQISRVIGGGHAAYANPREVSIDGKECVAGSMLHFDVRDEFAFDIDETVEMQIRFHAGSTAGKVTLTYDRSDAAPAFNEYFEPAMSKEIELSARNDDPWQTQVLSLERTRFSNGGFSGTDFSIVGQAFQADASGKIIVKRQEAVVCDVIIRRSFATVQPDAFGVAAIGVLDEKGQRTAVRMGIYDKSGRLPLPNEGAVRLRNFNGASRIVALRHGGTFWPVKNRSVFYVDGFYQAVLSVGDYELIVARGPEYRIARQVFSVEAHMETQVNVQLQRWIDMADKGWYSGDGHIHYTRESAEDDRDLLLFTQAEDLNLGNILQMGNSGARYFRQHDWRQISNADRSTFVLVPGQEDPRTSRRGHTIQLNLKRPIRYPGRYLLYHEVFAEARVQGGMTGYAHAYGNEGALESRAGLALDVPFGLIDFVEVLQEGQAAGQLWFDFLNMGYKLSPSAGTDYPYVDVPGAVRNYVYLSKEFSPRAWFAGLKAGQTFVTNGPLLEFSINRHGMGGDLHVKSGDTLSIKATATMNPDVDQLDRVELLEQGEVVKTVYASPGTTRLTLGQVTTALQGSWFAVRALGKQQDSGQAIVALSAPIYVWVDGRSFWKPAAIPQIVEHLKKDMQAVLVEAPELIESWDTAEPDASYWEAQKPLLEQRIKQASALYDALSKQAQRTKPKANSKPPT